MSLPLGNLYKTAYVVFADELKITLSLLEDIFSTLRSMETEAERLSLLSPHAGRLEQRFHVMRGGAGFLKLDLLHQTATKAELLFSQGQIQQPTEGTASNALEGIFTNLQLEQQSLQKSLNEE